MKTQIRTSLPVSPSALPPVRHRGTPDKTVDRGIDSKHLSQLKAGIWVDPNGCDHWIIDDGVEGYLSQRLDKYGKPVCSGVAPPHTVPATSNGGLRHLLIRTAPLFEQRRAAAHPAAALFHRGSVKLRTRLACTAAQLGTHTSDP